MCELKHLGGLTLFCLLLLAQIPAESCSLLIGGWGGGGGKVVKAEFTVVIHWHALNLQVHATYASAHS